MVWSLFAIKRTALNDRPRMKKNLQLLALLGVALPFAGLAQIHYNGGTYTQDFNALESGVISQYYATFPMGWDISGTFNSSSYVWTTVTNGYSDNYGAYCFSSSSNDLDKCIRFGIGSTRQAYLGAPRATHYTR